MGKFFDKVWNNPVTEYLTFRGDFWHDYEDLVTGKQFEKWDIFGKDGGKDGEGGISIGGVEEKVEEEKKVAPGETEGEAVGLGSPAASAAAASDSSGIASRGSFVGSGSRLFGFTKDKDGEGLTSVLGG